MIYKRHNQLGRRSLMILSLSAALIIGIGLILPCSTSKAAPVVTTVSVQDRYGYAPQAKVSVFNAQNGQQVANGLTDQGTGLFTFRSNNGTDLIVVIHSSAGYLAATRVRPGEFRSVLALQGETESRPFTTGAALNAPVIIGTEGTSAARNQTIQEMSFGLNATNSPTVDYSNAVVAVVLMDTFEQIARGRLGKDGQFTFDVPEDSGTSFFFAAVWGDAGTITLLRMRRMDPSIDGWLMTPAGS